VQDVPVISKLPYCELGEDASGKELRIKVAAYNFKQSSRRSLSGSTIASAHAAVDALSTASQEYKAIKAAFNKRTLRICGECCTFSNHVDVCHCRMTTCWLLYAVLRVLMTTGASLLKCKYEIKHSYSMVNHRHLSHVGPNEDLLDFMCEVVHLMHCTGGETSPEEFWSNAPALRPITIRTKCQIGGVYYPSPPKFLLEWNEGSPQARILKAGERAGASAAQTKVCNLPFKH
jgi:hypothetical protein